MFHNFYYVTTLRGKFYLLTKYYLNNVKMQIVIKIEESLNFTNDT